MDSIFDSNDPLSFLGESGNAEEPPPPPPTDLVPAGGDEEEPSNEPKTHRDLQRGALQELVDLVSECASVEAQIEGELQSTLGDAHGAGQKMISDAERKFKNLQDQLNNKVGEMKAQIEARYEQGVAAQRVAEQNLRNRVRSDFELAQQQVKKDYEQATWLAESVLEAEEGKASEALKRATELSATQTEYLNDKENQTAALLERYSYKSAPSEAIASIKEEEEKADPEKSFAGHRDIIEKELANLKALSLPKLFVGATPYLIGGIVLVLAVAIPQVMGGNLLQPQMPGLAIAAGGAVVFLIAFFVITKMLARKQMVAVMTPLRRALDAGRIANENLLARATMEHDLALSRARHQNKTELKAAKDRATPILDKAAKKRDSTLQAALAEIQAKNAQNELQRKNSLAELEQKRVAKFAQIQQIYEEETQKAGMRSSAQESQLRARHAEQRKSLEERWTKGLKAIQEPIREEGSVYPAWSDPIWDNWKGPTKFPATIRFGELQVDLKTMVDEVAKGAPFSLPLPGTFSVPALIAYPKQASIMLHTDRAGRMDSIRAMQMIMTRLMTALPPGRVRFTMIDPVGLGQNFAGFMHLADYDEALVGGRIWTDADQIDQRLANLTEHMETVIQKYLRNEYATIDDYNAQAGELAEPYRYLVIADFPVNFSEDSLRRLSSIASTGARCGVYTLVMRDTRVSTAGGTMHVDDLEAHSVNLVREGDKFVWRDPVFNQFPLQLDPPPTDDELSKILHQVGKGAREAKRVEVAFDLIAPKPPQFWTLKSDGDVGVAVGRSGATRVQMFKLGKGVAQHALVAGKTGSGKSTLLHALICNLAMWYSPDEVELYLIDFKKGVEFKTYAMHHLPHARAIAVESDREFGLSVLQRIDVEMGRRAELFRPYKAQNLQMYREASGKKMPRTLLIIDEFQEFFTEDDKLAQDASLLLDRIVRQGRAFGVHLLLGSQTIGGSSGLSRSTIGQIGVRIALQTSEADSQMILGDGNSAARLLSRPGEAIYNDAGGLVEGNSPFQVAWLPDEQRDTYLDLVSSKASKEQETVEKPIVFEGNEPADFRLNPSLVEQLQPAKYAASVPAPAVWLGDPVAIKAPTVIQFRRQSGANILIVGQNEEGAIAMTTLAMVALAAQLPPTQVSFYLFDGTPADGQNFGYLPGVAAALPHRTKVIDYRAVPQAIHEIARELTRRQAAEGGVPPAIFIVVFGLQRYRTLRKSEDFSFSADAKGADPGKEFADIMRDGPANGIHIITWIDTATALDRAVDRGSMRELDNRILFQMSATDSSNLIDSPAANKLGSNRALAYSEEQGSMEKFRPYAQPDEKWLADVKEKLLAKAQASGIKPDDFPPDLASAVDDEPAAEADSSEDSLGDPLGDDDDDTTKGSDDDKDAA
jgi:hypothetical protein